jgi:radical SAM superfamily enzyme YgiQ (UPF0313 family)
MNIVSLAFGFESGSERILNYLKKNTVTVEQNRNAIRLCKKYGFFVTGNYMLGNPGETREDLDKTLQLIRDSPIDELTITKTTPLPGTELWEYAKHKGIINEDMDWNKFSTRNFGDIFLSENLKKEDLDEYVKKIEPEIVKSHQRFSFKARYLLNPNFILRALKRRDLMLAYIKSKITASEEKKD